VAGRDTARLLDELGGPVQVVRRHSACSLRLSDFRFLFSRAMMRAKKN
jgi:hypothetical protein